MFLQSMLSSEHYIDEKAFYEAVRQYIISLLTFITVYFASYLIICRYKRKLNEVSDYEDDLVYKVAIWLCCFTMTVSIGAVLLLPFSIFTNEILLTYPDSYFVIWINDSLLHGLWNQIFLGTYMAMFLAMPFAYFFTESEGFAGSRKGIKARIYETFTVLLLLLILASTLVWVFSAFMAKNDFTWFAKVPVCTPLGFARLFSILGDYIVRPKFFVDLDDQIKSLTYDEESLQYKLASISERPNGSNGIYYTVQEDSYQIQLKLGNIRKEKLKLERERDASAFEKNLLYPLCLLGLLAVTTICFLLVGINCFKLLFDSESLPFVHKYPSLGKISISKLGWIGIFVQIFLIFYVMIASIVGLYTSPIFIHLKPKKDDTSMTTLIANSIIFLILSSALPVLVRTLGGTERDQ